MGGTPVIIHFNTFFFINHPAIGVPPFIETLKNTLTYNMFARNMWNEGRQDRPSMSKYDQNMIKHAQNSLSAHIVANSCKFSNPGVTMVPPLVSGKTSERLMSSSRQALPRTKLRQRLDWILMLSRKRAGPWELSTTRPYLLQRGHPRNLWTLASSPHFRGHFNCWFSACPYLFWVTLLAMPPGCMDHGGLVKIILRVSSKPDP